MSNIGINELDQGIWTDPNTGLIWARISIGQEWINGQCIGDAQEFNWDDANHACQSFRLAGFSDWRLLHLHRYCKSDISENQPFVVDRGKCPVQQACRLLITGR